MNTAVITGATGEIGKRILKLLIEEQYYSKIYILGRKSISNIEDNKKIEKIIIDFDNLEFDVSILKEADVFSALGTGGNGLFEKIDYRYPLALAAKCHNLSKSFNIVSAMGANSKSFSYYQKIKGRAEEDLQNYNLGNIRIYRPSMLIAPDRENITTKEKIFINIFKILDPFFIWKLKNWRGIEPDYVAKAMVSNAVNQSQKGIYKREHIMNSFITK